MRGSLGADESRGHYETNVTFVGAITVELPCSGCPVAFQECFTIGNPIANIYIFGSERMELLIMSLVQCILCCSTGGMININKFRR